MQPLPGSRGAGTAGLLAFGTGAAVANKQTHTLSALSFGLKMVICALWRAQKKRAYWRDYRHQGVLKALVIN
jgi:hypothetical protein